MTSVAQRAGDVLVFAAAEHQLERETFIVDSLGRPHHAAMGEAAVAPQVCRAEKEKTGLVAAELIASRPRRRNGTTEHRDGCRGDAPHTTHRGPRPRFWQAPCGAAFSGTPVIPSWL